jgi:hypothetical protein
MSGDDVIIDPDDPRLPINQAIAKDGQTQDLGIFADVPDLNVPKQRAPEQAGQGLGFFADLPDLVAPTFTAKATGYHPVDPGHPEYKMEGGRVGAEEWHGKKLAQERLFTLDQFRRGEAPYVSVAMDNTHNNPLDYGDLLESPDFPGVPFRVMDTGSAFNGRSRQYGGPKGLTRIDIARDTSQGANSKENNRRISFQLAGEEIRRRIGEFPTIAGKETKASVEATGGADESLGIFADLPQAGGAPAKPAAEGAPAGEEGLGMFSDLPTISQPVKIEEPPPMAPPPPPREEEPSPPTDVPPGMAPSAPQQRAIPTPMPGPPSVEQQQQAQQAAQLQQGAAQQPAAPAPGQAPLPTPQQAAQIPLFEQQVVAPPPPQEAPSYFQAKAGVMPEQAVEMAPVSQPGIIRNAYEAAVETGQGFIPTSLDALNKLVTPATDAPSQVRRGYDVVKDFIQGTPIDDIIKQRVPESQLLVEADKTPAFSKERFKAGFQVVSQMAMAAALGKQVKGKAKVEARAKQWTKPSIREQPGTIAQTTNEALARAQQPQAAPQQPVAAAVSAAEPGVAGRVTSTKNAVVDAERQARGLEPIMQEAAQSNPATMAAAEAKLEANPGYGRALVSELLVGGKQAINAVDEAVLLREKITAQNARERSAQISERTDISDAERAEAKQAYEDWETYINDIDKATRKSGEAWGRMGQFRQRLARQDYSLVAVERRMRIAKGGKPLTKEESATLQKQVKDIDRASSKLEQKRERLERQLAQKKGLEPTPPRFKAGPLADLEVEMLQTELNRLRRVQAEQSRLPEAKRRTARQIADVENRLANYGFAKPPKPVRIVPDKELRGLQYELAKSKETLDRGIFMAGLKHQNFVQRTGRIIGEILAVPRALRASMDLSALRRQGGLMFMAHPIRSLKAFGGTVKAVTEKGYHDVLREIRERPNAPEYHQFKLSITDVDPMAGLSQMEEFYQSRWARSIPVLGKAVGASERIYTAFLNRLRADSYDAMKATLGRNGEVTPEQGRILANFINVWTGRGALPDKLAGSMVLMNNFFFAPRYVMSRFQTLIGQPIWHGVGKHGLELRARALIAGEYARMFAGYGTVYGLVRMMAPNAVEYDPRSSDFGKIKIGNTRIDIMSGVSQATVFATRLAAIPLERLGLIRGTYKTAGGQVSSISSGVAYGKTKVGDVIAGFGRSKLAPVPATLWDYLEGRNMVGQPVTLASTALNLTEPLSWNDIYGAIEKQGLGKGAALGTLALFGDGVQTYSPRVKPGIPGLPPPPSVPPLSLPPLPPLPPMP